MQQSRNGVDHVQAGVLETQQLFWIALKTKDSQIFEEILADSFVLRSPGQPDQSRDEFIRTLTSFPAIVTSVTSDNLDIRYFGNMAVLSGVQTAHLQFHDNNSMVDVIAITNIFEFVADEWLMVLSHAVELPAESTLESDFPPYLG
ncbi:MAG: nuclear transport factor 2 family protein [Anaerolineae bacterium]